MHLKDTILLKIHAPNSGVLKFTKKSITTGKVTYDPNVVIVVDLKTLLLPIERSSRNR